MNRILFLALILTVISGNISGQDIKFRLGGNFGKFNSEIGAEEIEHPLVGVLSNPDATQFEQDLGIGFEAEIMIPWTEGFETGFEFKRSNFSGWNETPPYYNFYFSNDKPRLPDGTAIPITTTVPQIYESSTNSLILNLRYYILPGNTINPFLKASAGVSYTSAIFQFEDAELNAELPSGYLYSNDTKDAVLFYGGGFGIDFEVSEKVSLYIDGSLNVIGSDLVDGIPNYNYENNSGVETITRTENQALFTQLTIGLAFHSGIDLGLTSGQKNSGGKGAKRTGRTSDYRPFYRQK